MLRPLTRLIACCLACAIPLAHAADPADLPATPEAWLAKMLDGRKNGAAFKDPEAFAAWLDAVTEPRFMTALATAAVDPATYPKALSDAIDPATARNWAEFTDPQLYLRWMLASGTPSFQQAIIRKMTDPAKMNRWLEAAYRPDHLAPVAAAIERAPAAWLKASSDPSSYAPLARLAQPGTPWAWMEAFAGQWGSQEWRRLPASKTSHLNPAPRYRY